MVVVSLVVSSVHQSRERLVLEMIHYVLSGTLNLCLYHESFKFFYVRVTQKNT